MSTKKSAVSRRTAGDGGRYRKVRYRTDPMTGRTIEVVYFEASWDVPPHQLPVGVTRKRITGSGPSATIALRNLEANKEAFLSGKSRGREAVKGIPRGKVPTVAELFEAWTHELDLSDDISDIVVGKYKGFFENHILPYIGDTKITKLDWQNLSLLFSDTLAKKKDKRTGRKLTGGARLNIYRALSKFLNYAVIHGFIKDNPLRAVAKPKVRTPQPDVEMYSELADGLLEKLRKDKDPDYCRWLMQFLGLRRAERLGLRWSDITDLNGDKPLLTVRRQLARYDTGGWYLKPTKTGKERKIPLSEPWISALREHKKYQDELRKLPTWKPAPGEGFGDLVFTQRNGRFITLNSDNLHWHKVLDKYSLPYWRGHINRHITASRLAATDPPTPPAVAMALLGHDSEAMNRWYTKVMERQQVPAMETYGATFMPRRKK